MGLASRRELRTVNTWPGFVDALAALLMVVIFLLMVFVLAQFFLNDALSGRDAALESLRSRVNELAELLSLERQTSGDLRENLTSLSGDLQAALAERDELGVDLRLLSERAADAESRADELLARLAAADAEAADATSALAAERARAAGAEERARSLEQALGESRETVGVQRRELERLAAQIISLQALKKELEAEIAKLGTDAEVAEARAIREAELSESARAEVARLNQQLAQLRADLARLAGLLDVAEADIDAKRIEIQTLGARLNAALADRVEELSRYRSEFFGRMSEVLGDESDIRIVGDRFVFQSEVLFGSGSAEIDASGRQELRKIVGTLNQLTELVPEEIPWVLQVNGHTDSVPIRNEQFASNWELSMARALSVVALLIDAGFPPSRLAAAGFGEHQPLEPDGSEEARRRNRRIELKLTQP